MISKIYVNNNHKAISIESFINLDKKWPSNNYSDGRLHNHRYRN